MRDSEATSRDVQAAGVVAFRPGKQVLVVHRPKYDDWSFPKGKLDHGEHPVAAAVREVAEETGLHVRLGRPLSDQRYDVASGDRRRMKTVRYWVARAVGDDDVSDYRPNHEVDDVAWVPHEEAQERLTYPYDRLTLREALEARHKTVAVVVLRHAEARSRKAWRGDDAKRPLLQRGLLQAQQLVPLLAAYDVRRVVSSRSTRCVQTVCPYVDTAEIEIDETEHLTEEHAKPDQVRRTVDDAVTEAAASKRGLAICSHRPVLPDVFEALGVPDPKLAAGEFLVAHLGRGRVVATEGHRPR